MARLGRDAGSPWQSKVVTKAVHVKVSSCCVSLTPCTVVLVTTEFFLLLAVFYSDRSPSLCECLSEKEIICKTSLVC